MSHLLDSSGSDRLLLEHTSARSSDRALPLLIAGAAVGLLVTGIAAGADDTAPGDSDLETITVTATRREEDIRRVPINVTAYSQDAMDDLGVRQIDDLARLTPDLQFTHTSGSAGNNSTDISIRGVFSDVGSATTGIYIDDTPIQMRNVGYWNANAFPQVFDLERVEVLRGPQGTLFGAGAEGGAVRFITPEPSLDKFSGYARADAGYTLSGSPSYEAGLAVGGPIIDDIVGFRVSAWGRKDGGYIDRVSVDTGQTVDKNANGQRSDAGKAALTVAPVANLRITASLYYQQVDNDDRDQYWSTLSNPSSDDFRQGSRQSQPTQDDFYLPTLKITYHTDSVSFFSNSSYYYHRDYADLDYTNYFGGIFDGDPLAYAPGDVPSNAYITNKQSGITQEFRVQSLTDDALVDWTGGLYYSRLTQKNVDVTTDGQFVYTSVNGEVPSFVQYTESTDKEVAGYGNVTVNATSQLKLTAGVRVSRTTFDFDQTGSYQGFALTPVSGKTTATPVTPKFGVSYQLDPDNFVYATVAKGYRTGGVNGPIPADLCTNEPVPESAAYNPDSLWSYEIGSKNGLFGGTVQLDSSIYEIKWKNIQQAIRYTNCGFSFVGNLGSATGYGGDIAARFKITNDLLAGISVSYTDIEYDQTILEGQGAVVSRQGDKIGGPPFNLAAFAKYKFNILGQQAFYRVDYTYHNRTPGNDPATVSYDPTLTEPGDNRYLTMRAGIYVSGWELSAYGNNLTKEETPLSISHDIPGSEPYYLSSYRPLTFGVTAIYRF